MGGALRCLLGPCWLLAIAACGGTAAPGRAAPRPAHRPTTTLIMTPDVQGFRGDDPSLTQVHPTQAGISVAARSAGPIERARALYRDLKFQQSLTAISEAQRALEGAATTSDDFEALHLALLYRGMNELALGRADQAEAALRTAAGLRPQAVLDEGRFPPDVRELHARLLATLQAEGPASLAVTTEPPQARVLLDGIEIGHAPASLHTSAGVHFLRVEALGHAPRGLPLRLRPGGNAALHVQLPPAEPGLTAQQLANTPPSALESLTGHQLAALGRSLDTERVLLVATREDGADAIALDLGSGDLTRASIRQASSVEETVRALLAEVDAPLATPAQPAQAADGPWYGSPWLWTALVVALGAGVGAALLLDRDQPPTVRVVDGAP